MSHYSGFSSASRLEIERLNQVHAQLAADNAAEMAAQKSLLVAQEARLASMQAMLVSNGLLKEPIQGTSAQALAHDQAQASLFRVRPPQAEVGNEFIGDTPQNNSTPGRKRHSSQQLQGAAKDIRVMANSSNRFELLNHPSS
jgi:hypothetical protein